MKNKIVIKINNYTKLEVVRKLVRNDIYYENLRIKEDGIFLLINIKYLNKIKKIFKRI